MSNETKNAKVTNGKKIGIAGMVLGGLALVAGAIICKKAKDQEEPTEFELEGDFEEEVTEDIEVVDSEEE